ncbi:MAG: membrane protein insertase YidC [Rickettsiales bacterium]
MSDLRNLILAVVSATIVLFGWNYFYEMPRQEVQRKNSSKLAKMHKEKKLIGLNRIYSRNEVLNNSPRIKVDTPRLGGSISLRGGRIDDLILKNYHSTVEKDSPLVELLSPSGTDKSYFAEFGWVTNNKSIEVPTAQTLWKADKTVLQADSKVNLYWYNNQGIKFVIEYILDDDYMFSIKQTVINKSNKVIQYQNYGLVSRLVPKDAKSAVFHEGPIGVFNKLLKETSYSDLTDDKKISYMNNGSGSWLGFSDKYWLTSIVPDFAHKFDAHYTFVPFDTKHSRFQVDYVGELQALNPGQEDSNISYFYAGAKSLSLLEFYQEYLKLDLFDRAIDFGWFYFITKPLFNALKYFYDLVGNFGISILIVTVIVKVLLMPLANKSFRSMNKMKKLQPQIAAIKELHSNDKMKMNQAMMELYKREKVSPLSGCLPLLIQIPIFFSLYKVIFISIEMRHAPFFGWIRDLSAPDPTSVFNLFGLIPWSPPSLLMIGVWPIVMAITMYLQQKMSPPPSDPAQATMMKFLPLIFLFMFSSFPAGLVIYWAWSNILSIGQQYYLKR